VPCQVLILSFAMQELRFGGSVRHSQRIVGYCRDRVLSFLYWFMRSGGYDNVSIYFLFSVFEMRFLPLDDVHQFSDDLVKEGIM